MTSLTLIKDGDTATIVTDGATCFRSILVSMESKQWRLPHLNVVCGFRGHAGFSRRIRHLTSQCESIEELRGIGGKLRRYAKCQRLLPKVFEFDLGFVGHDGRAPFACLVSSIRRPQSQAFELLEVPYLWTSPSVSPDDVVPVAEDFQTGIVRLVDKQRRGKQAVVGGYIEATTVAAAGSATRCLKQYRDRLLKKIDAAETTGVNKPVRPVLQAVGWR